MSALRPSSDPTSEPTKETTMTPNTSRRLMLGSLALSVAALAACASTRTSEGTGEYVDDTVLTGRVKAAILADPVLKSAEINVETFKGRVQLSGFVNSQSDINHAAVMVRGMKGVTSVANDMRLK
jgi:osmotically-inducible protein OsmY